MHRAIETVLVFGVIMTALAASGWLAVFAMFVLFPPLGLLVLAAVVYLASRLGIAYGRSVQTERHRAYTRTRKVCWALLANAFVVVAPFGLMLVSW